MSRFTRISQITITFIIVATIGLVGGWAFTKVSTERENAALAEASEKLEKSTLKIVYLSSNEIPEVAQAATENNITIVNSANFAQKLDTQTLFDVLVFDQSFIGQLDQKWVQTRYRQGMAVSGINVSISDLASLVGDKTAISGPWLNVPTPKTRFFSLLQVAVSGDNPKEIERYFNERESLINEDGSFNPLEGITSPLSISRTKAQSEIADQKTLDSLFHSISAAIVDQTR